MNSSLQAPPLTEQLPAPIFILGIGQRSGTNYLHDLLSQHPDCVGSDKVIWEDFVVAHSDLLVQYADSVYDMWRSNTRLDSIMGPPTRVICESFGRSLLEILYAQALKASPQPALSGRAGGSPLPRLVTKTPSVRNLRHFFTFFPQAHLLIVIRDGRSVVESAHRSFNWSYEKAMQEWAQAAKAILDFDRDPRNRGRSYSIVRYEELNQNTEQELRRILAFLDLDPAAYDFNQAINLPVKGSSELRSNGKGPVHWKPVEKTKEFNPLKRASHWGRPLHERFNWVAGQYQRELGYETKSFPAGPLPWPLLHLLMDARWQGRQALRYAYRRAKGKRP